jgi:hypothetical protein
MTSLGHHRDDSVIKLDDTDTYQLYSAARELEAHLLFQQARKAADVRALLVELYERDGIQVEHSVVDAEAEDVFLQERADRFLQELTSRIRPDTELLVLAGQLDDDALGVWREAAASLVEDLPPSFLHLRERVEEERRAELRSRGHLVRTEAQLGARLARFGLLGRLLLHRGEVVDLRSKVTNCQQLGNRSEQRLGWLKAKLEVIDRAERARAAWMADVHEVLARGLAATRVLTQRTEQAITAEFEQVPARPAASNGPLGPRVAS